MKVKVRKQLTKNTLTKMIHETIRGILNEGTMQQPMDISVHLEPCERKALDGWIAQNADALRRITTAVADDPGQEAKWAVFLQVMQTVGAPAAVKQAAGGQNTVYQYVEQSMTNFAEWNPDRQRRNSQLQCPEG